MKKNLPKISIITPSLNQARFIEKTIQSVISQNYPFLEYLIIDGGSTDETVTILKKYKRHVRWISEKDRGQSHAINKGLRLSSGEITGFVNSDDFLYPQTLTLIGNFFSSNPKAYWLTGKCQIVDENGLEVRKIVTWYKNILLKYFRQPNFLYVSQFISQPATFWRRSAVNEIGYFAEDLHYDMDYDYWLRLWQKYPLYFLDSNLAAYRVHRTSKAVSSPETQFKIAHQIVSRYTKSRSLLFLHKLHNFLALKLYRKFWL